MTNTTNEHDIVLDVNGDYEENEDYEDEFSQLSQMKAFAITITPIGNEDSKDSSPSWLIHNRPYTATDEI